MDQHPSPIARLSRELGDSGTKEILPPTERNLKMLSEGKLEELEKVARAATPGPWETTGNSVTNWHDHTFEMEWSANGQENEDGTNANYRADAEHIATFDPPTVLALISELRALRAERDEAVADRNAHAEHVRRMAKECEDGLTALEQIDACWEAYGCPNNRAHLSLAEQVSATLRENEAARDELAALRAQAPAPVGGDALYDALWELVAALAQHPTLKLGGRLADALDAGRMAALAERARRVSPDPTEGGTDE